MRAWRNGGARRSETFRRATRRTRYGYLSRYKTARVPYERKDCIRITASCDRIHTPLPPSRAGRLVSNEVAIAEAGGIEAIVAVLRAHRATADVQEWGCAALSTLAADDPSNQVRRLAPRVGSWALHARRTHAAPLLLPRRESQPRAASSAWSRR